MKDGSYPILTFVSTIIASIAWPLTVLTCVILLRRHLLSLIPLLRKVKYSDVEISFGAEIAELTKSASTSELPVEVPKAARWEDLITMADVRPRTAIRLAFRRVEDSIDQIARKENIPIADGAWGMPMVIGAILLNQGSITSAQYDLLSKLRVLADQAERAAPDTITADSVTEFVDLAMRLAASLEDAPAKKQAV